ncbi:hypothetical protein M5K25_023542 [Dendrobium thyrsiflorum]|uniref:Uncharacterized protein n=1 Tax=Dendrobium thyrsiflorum TaxID=117978 RepID=A0ABD0U916_DENTH
MSQRDKNLAHENCRLQSPPARPLSVASRRSTVKKRAAAVKKKAAFLFPSQTCFNMQV